MPEIKTYAVLPPAYVEYDPAAPGIAARAGARIEAAAPWLKVEHVGSTAIPGCAGKGIVDLVALYPRGTLDATRKAIDALGFQRQRAGHEFPEERPMRVGAIEFQGQTYRLHVHVVAAHSDEAGALRRFRDMLRADSSLRDAYQSRKRAILESGANDSIDYTHAKGEFIKSVIGAAR